MTSTCTIAGVHASLLDDMSNGSSKQQRLCDVEGCDRKTLVKTFCGKHYQRFMKYGDPNFSGKIHIGNCPLKDRLFMKRKITKDGCWNWTGNKRSYGRGYFIRKGMRLSVPRVSAMIFLGFDMKSELCVCHHCDNPSCFRPDHLFIGTQKDNARDMLEKGRGNKPRGERNHKAILTEKQVIKIRKEYCNGTKVIELARKYGLAGTSMSSVVHGITWKHLPMPNEAAKR